MGTVQPRKNLQRLIEAFARLKAQDSRFNNLKLFIAGKLGWNYDEVVRLAKMHSVIITGYVDETIRQILLKNALVYVQPSITEGFGLPILEAMAAGVPVVSSSGGALPEVVGDAGLLFDPYNIDEMGDKIKEAMGNRQLINKGWKRVKEFSWDKATIETYNILTKL